MMETLLAILRGKVADSIGRAFGDALSSEERSADIAPCMQEEFGHYQCNSPLRLAKPLKISPRAAAQKIIDHLEDPAIFSKIEIAGPGFINFTLSPDYLSGQLQNQLFDPLLGASPPAKRKKIIVEFSSPECRQRTPCRPYPFNHRRRLPRASLRIFRPRRFAAQPYRRLGHPIRHADHIYE